MAASGRAHSGLHKWLLTHESCGDCIENGQNEGGLQRKAIRRGTEKWARGMEKAATTAAFDTTMMPRSERRRPPLQHDQRCNADDDRFPFKSIPSSFFSQQALAQYTFNNHSNRLLFPYHVRHDTPSIICNVHPVYS